MYWNYDQIERDIRMGFDVRWVNDSYTCLVDNLGKFLVNWEDKNYLPLTALRLSGFYIKEN